MLKRRHKLLSEVVNFPDRTNKDFYHSFNAELLMSLGIMPVEEMLDDIFEACSYLPWEKFKDADWLNNCPLPVGVISNFNNGLPRILGDLFGNIFSDIIVSENVQTRKPDLTFFRYGLETTGVPANQILYIGDSLKLDIIPAQKLGFQVLLVDRIEFYYRSTFSIRDFFEIPQYLRC